jgi:peptide/nickel transport system permease protein
MWGYILKRLLWFIPTLFLVTLLGFVLLVNAPGDPLDLLVNPLSSKSSGNNNPEIQKQYWRKQLGLDLPVFYFSVTTLSEPDTLYKIYDKQKLKAYKQFLLQTGNKETLGRYFSTVNQYQVLWKSWINKQLENHVFVTDLPALQASLSSITTTLKNIESTADTTQLCFHIQALKNSQGIIKKNIPDFAGLIEQNLAQLYANKTTYKNFIPKIVWYGTHNRYHQWLFGSKQSKGIIRGDFGISYIKKEPVIAIIKDKVIWSLFFSLLSIILAYLISIPIGIRLAAKPHSRFTQFSLFLLYSMPSFFAGVLLLMLFANPDIISVFPPSGIKPIGGYADDANLFEKLYDSLPYIILPLICYTYSSLAYISRLTQTSIMEQLPLDYIKTARAKGLTDKAIIRNHALKNSLLPLITVFSVVFPSIIGGSVIIESIFTIPGMGRETVKAIIAKDYPIVIAIITLSCLLTMLSYLIADLLYAWADPRIRYKT